MANEIENNSTFANSKPEPTESERIIQRIQNFKVGITPDQANSVSQILEKGLANGIFKLGELRTITSISEEINKGVIDYNSQVQIAQKRLSELQEQELVAKQTELAKRESEKAQELTDERQRRKKAEDEVRILKAQLEALSGVAGNVTQAPISVEQPHAPKETKPKSKAWEMIRAGRPHIDDAYDSDLSGTIKTEPKDDPDLVEAVTPDETTLSRREQVLMDPLSASENRGLYHHLKKEDATTTSVDKSFKEFVSELKEEDIDLPELNDLGEDLTSAIPQHRLKSTHYMEDTFEELEESQESDFKFVEEDEKTKPTFSGPKITGGNAPNIKAVVEEPKNVEAKVDKPIRQYDSEEELLADAQRRAEERKAQQEAEEEFEEVTIPSESELRAMTKNEIQNIAQTLGFTSVVSTLTKDKMVETFLSETEEFIQSLQDSGEFVSATDTDTEETKDGDDIRDGGYF
jgi:hypothetical protein